MNGTLLRHTWRFHRTRLALVSIALAVWGFLLAVVYAQFGSQFSALMNSGILPEQFARFGGGDVFSLSGTIALGFIHPIAHHPDVGVRGGVFGVGRRRRAAAGHARSRPGAADLTASVLPHAARGLVRIHRHLHRGTPCWRRQRGDLRRASSGQLAFRNVPLLWLNSVLLFGAIATIALAASVSFDRLTPALGVTLGIVIVMYVLEVLGSLWPAAEKLQPYSLFHYLKAKAILTGTAAPFDLTRPLVGHSARDGVGAGRLSAA